MSNEVFKDWSERARELLASSDSYSVAEKDGPCKHSYREDSTVCEICGE